MQQGKAGLASPGQASAAPKPGSSFLDEWLAKRQQLGGQAPKPSSAPAPANAAPFGSMGASSPATPPAPLNDKAAARTEMTIPDVPVTEPAAAAAEPDKLHLRGDHKNDDGEVAIKLR
jgi:hypothetical protein